MWIPTRLPSCAFFLLRPGEYTFTTDNEPFRLCDVKLYIGSVGLDPSTASEAQFHAVTSVSLTFTTQKNGVKGEVITHGCSGDLLVCPCKALTRRVRYLIQERAPPTTPLCTYYRHDRRGLLQAHFVKSRDIRDALRKGLAVVGPQTLDIQPRDIEARSLRAGGATALLCANVDFDSIRLIGRWKSDAMIRYLHMSANPAVQRHARQMYHGGHYSFTPDTPNQVPMH